MKPFDLTGRTALVTGGGRGLGKGMAVALASAGANVAVLSRSRAQLAAALEEVRQAGPNGSHMAIPCDAADLPPLDAAVKEVAARNGGLDVLLHAAGLQIRKPALAITAAEYDSLMAVQLRAAFFASQYAARIMEQQGRGGKILHVASLGTAIGLRNAGVYTAAKSGIAGMVRTMALEWAPLGIQVNAIGPGYYRTEMTEPLFEDPDRRAWIASRIAAGRTGEVADLAGPIIFLASGASDYVTGQVLYVDGGWLAG